MKSSNTGMWVVFGIVLIGGVGWYFYDTKIKNSKTGVAVSIFSGWFK